VKLAVGIGLGVVTIVTTLAVAHAHDRITTRVTWNGDIARIVEARCVGCHSPEGRGPMSLVTYEAARPWAKAIKEEVMTRRMPKWHAARGYGDFKNDPSLSSFEIALITAWADGGAPKGLEEENKSPGRKPRPTDEGTIEPRVRRMALPCGEHPLSEGSLLSVQPILERDASIGIVIKRPDGQREIVAWIRGYDPDFPTVYHLRTAIQLTPGTVLTTQPRDGCSINVSLSESR
jgi:hypothetical protein